MKVTMTSGDDEDDNDGMSHTCDAGANDDIANDYNSDNDTVEGHFDKPDGSFFFVSTWASKNFAYRHTWPSGCSGAQVCNNSNQFLIAAGHSEAAPARRPKRPSWASGGSGAQTGQFCYYF